MSTLLIRLAAPLQSWGIDSKFERRNTGRTPSKSGVVGLCAAALGYNRREDEKIKKLAGLRFGVRVDNPGTLQKDFHMAHEESFWDSSDRTTINRDKKASSYLTMRYYLSDAVFLVGLEGDEGFLMDIDEALRFPRYPLFLGRRGCPPEGHVALGVVSDSLKESLERYPRLAITRSSKPAEKNLRILVDAEKRGSEFNRGVYLLRDLPLSFNPEHRKYDLRTVCEYDANISQMVENIESHDAFAAVEEVLPCI